MQVLDHEEKHYFGVWRSRYPTYSKCKNYKCAYFKKNYSFEYLLNPMKIVYNSCLKPQNAVESKIKILNA